MDILRKSLAPISDAAWEEINEEAVVVLKSVLSARRFVDVEGPKGWAYEAVSLGRLDVPANQKGSVKYGINKVLPLVETRIPFELDIWELDNAARGAGDIDLDPLDEAGRKIAEFEEDVIYNGFKQSAIEGIKKASGLKPVKFPERIEDLPNVVTECINKFIESSVEGPYTLVLSSDKWEKLMGHSNGYPLKRVVADLLKGKIIMAPSIKDSFMVSERGGDFKLTIGQDFSIGYESHDAKKVRLYFTESFTFQAFEPNAIVVFN